MGVLKEADMRNSIQSALEVGSLVSIVVGVSLVSFAAGLIVAGALGLWVTNRMARR